MTRQFRIPANALAERRCPEPASATAMRAAVRSAGVAAAHASGARARIEAHSRNADGMVLAAMVVLGGISAALPW